MRPSCWRRVISCSRCSSKVIVLASLDHALFFSSIEMEKNVPFVWFRLTAWKGCEWAEMAGSPNGFFDGAPFYERRQTTFGDHARTHGFSEAIKGKGMVLNVEDEHDFRFFIRSPWSSL